MKTPSNALFKLIRKMTPSEKRYFKRFGLLQQKKDENKYTLLFDAINEQTAYDEPALHIQFEGYDFVNNFSEIKKYLFNQIKKALRNYHSQSSIDIVLYNYLSDISILYSKELYIESQRIIKKAEKLALRHEKFSILVVLTEWKRNVLRIGHHVDGIQKYLDNEIEKDKIYISNIENENMYFNKSLELNLHLRRRGPSQQLNSQLPLPENGPTTFRAKRYLYLENSMMGYLDFDDKKIYEASLADVELFESNPHFIETLPKQYIISLTNHLDSCSKTKCHENFDKYMWQTIEVLNSYSFDPEFTAKEKLLVYILKSTIYILRGDSTVIQDARKELLDQFELTLKKGYKTPGLTIYVHDILLRTAIVLDDYPAALESYNNISQLNLGNYREDLQMETRLLGLIPHYEMGNWILLESMIRSGLRLLHRKHSHFKLGKLFLEAIKKCVSMRQHRNFQEKEITDILLQLKKDSLSVVRKKRLGDFMVFVGWIDSKISNDSICNCIKKSIDRPNPAN